MAETVSVQVPTQKSETCRSSISPPGLGSHQDKWTLVPTAEIVCVCLYVSPEAPCSASEHPVTVSVLIGVEDTNIQLALILMKLKWTDYNWSSTHVCMLLSLCTHMHGFAHMDLQCSALPWLRVQGLLFVCVCVCAHACFCWLFDIKPNFAVLWQD